MKDSVLTHPALKGLRMGSREWFAAQRRLIHSKPPVKRCYDLWYRKLLEDMDTTPPETRSLPAIELGSGSSYIREFRPDIITSDVERGIAQMTIDGRDLPFADASVRALLLVHCFHHIPDVGRFLSEAARVLAPGGVISIIDETHTPFARFFFSTFHPEPYDDAAAAWEFPQSDSMLDSNQALSWIVFFRDRTEFERRFPELQCERYEYLPWFSYLLSGGVNLRSFYPGVLSSLVQGMDTVLRPLDRLCAIHWHITVRKKDR